MTKDATVHVLGRIFGGTRPRRVSKTQGAAGGSSTAGETPAEKEEEEDASVELDEQGLDAMGSNEVAQRHAKLCMDASGLIRKGAFGGIALFDGTLEEQVGHMDASALRAIYGEHVLAENAQTSFSPPNNPTLKCTPEDELFYVVGKDGIDTEKWELKTCPTCERKTGDDRVDVRKGDVLMVKDDVDAVKSSFKDSDLDLDHWDVHEDYMGMHGVVSETDDFSVCLEHEDGQLVWWPYGAVVMETSALEERAAMTEGRNCKSIRELMESDEAKRAGLRDVEVIALRLYSGKSPTADLLRLISSCIN